jgi:hypothetical protein
MATGPGVTGDRRPTRTRSPGPSSSSRGLVPVAPVTVPVTRRSCQRMPGSATTLAVDPGPGRAFKFEGVRHGRIRVIPPVLAAGCPSPTRNSQSAVTSHGQAQKAAAPPGRESQPRAGAAPGSASESVPASHGRSRQSGLGGGGLKRLGGFPLFIGVSAPTLASSGSGDPAAELRTGVSAPGVRPRSFGVRLRSFGASGLRSLRSFGLSGAGWGGSCGGRR